MAESKSRQTTWAIEKPGILRMQVDGKPVPISVAADLNAGDFDIRVGDDDGFSVVGSLAELQEAKREAVRRYDELVELGFTSMEQISGSLLPRDHSLFAVLSNICARMGADAADVLFASTKLMLCSLRQLPDEERTELQLQIIKITADLDAPDDWEFGEPVGEA